MEKQSAKRAKVELIKCGVIPALLNDLDSWDPDTDDPRQRIRITRSLFRLHNLVSTDKAIPIYRAAKAVDILMKFAQAKNVMTKIDSLHVLACIINEKESELLVATTECIATIVEMHQKAAESKDKEYTLWKFVAENHTENFATLKITLKNNIKEGFTENYTEKRPLLFRNAKNG